MDKTTENIVIKDLKVLGGYGKMCQRSDVYPHSLRKLTLDVKKNDITAITVAALLLSQLLTPGSVIIPIPQSSGKAEYTLELANIIRIIRQDCKVADILSSNPRKKLYDIKKSEVSLKDVEFDFYVEGNSDDMAAIESDSNIVLLDNVVNTGFTFNCARKALRNYIKNEPSLLAISATSNWFNDK